MHSQVVGIIELDEGASVAALTPRIVPHEVPASPQHSAAFPLNTGRAAVSPTNFVLVVTADTELLGHELREEYRQLLLQWMDEEVER